MNTASHSKCPTARPVLAPDPARPMKCSLEMLVANSDVPMATQPTLGRPGSSPRSSSRAGRSRRRCRTRWRSRPERLRCRESSFSRRYFPCSNTRIRAIAHCSVPDAVPVCVTRMNRACTGAKAITVDGVAPAPWATGLLQLDLVARRQEEVFLLLGGREAGDWRLRTEVGALRHLIVETWSDAPLPLARRRWRGSRLCAARRGVADDQRSRGD